MTNDKKGEPTPAYPRPSEADRQQQNQPEFIDQQPNDFRDKSISDLPANDNRQKESNEPEE